MIRKKNRIISLILLVLTSQTMAAQGDFVSKSDSLPDHTRMVTNAKLIGMGATNLLDTYLSPEKYNGVDLRFISHTVRERKGSDWSRQMVWQGQVAFADNRAKEGSEMAGTLNFSYGMHRQWQLMDGRLRLKAGALLDANVGFLYNTRNGNNPAQARLSLDLSPSVAAAYHFHLWGKPLMVRYEVSAPLMGVMFSPNYGQSYYEIFSEGNYDHNVVPTTIGSTPSLRHMLTLDFRLLRTTWRIGYLGDYRQANVNNLKQHTYTHSLVIGVVKRFTVVKL